MSSDTYRYIVISLGGSLIAPNEVDTTFVRSFCKQIREYVSDGYRFIIIAGGGHVTRKYQHALDEIGDVPQDSLDWIGIHATHLNAHFMRLSFQELAEDTIITDPTVPITSEKPVIMGGGWKPGWSTDYDAVLIAKNLGAKHVVNLSNIEYVYDKDPKIDESAQPIEEITWKAFRKLLPDEWVPGANTPFDPIAAREAEKLGLTVVTLYGSDLTRFDDYVSRGIVRGTKIAPAV